MAVTVYDEGTQACTTVTEHFLTANPETTDGVYQVFLDLNELALGETLLIRLYETVIAAGTKRIFWQDFVAHPQSPPIWISPLFAAVHGWDVSVEAVFPSGSLNIPWSIRTT